MFCRKTASPPLYFLFLFIFLRPAACPFLLLPSLIRRPVGPRPGRPVYRSSGPRGHSPVPPVCRLSPPLSEHNSGSSSSQLQPCSPAQRPGLAGLSRPHRFTAPAMTLHPSFLSHCPLPPTSHTVEATNSARSRHRSSMRAASISVRSAARDGVHHRAGNILVPAKPVPVSLSQGSVPASASYRILSSTSYRQPRLL